MQQGVGGTRNSKMMDGTLDGISLEMSFFLSNNLPFANHSKSASLPPPGRSLLFLGVPTRT